MLELCALNGRLRLGLHRPYIATVAWESRTRRSYEALHNTKRSPESPYYAALHTGYNLAFIGYLKNAVLATN